MEKYLNDYFKSLVNQTIGFKSHIHLILVDDDSPDNSAKIIHEWVEKYPDNITYIHKENGGQASARNLGMDFAKTKWVSFIDPDDFICLDYF
ncbi:MAG: glycosyltransferase [Gilliamella sp.]|nr:glycosyltransferase [Gilliamella sp.]